MNYATLNNIQKGGTMTRNQIEYWRLVENKRSNLANEAENKRANLARELETNRSNLAREAESHRANVAIEQITSLRDLRSYLTNMLGIQETIRANKARESISTRQAVETERSNRERERQQLLSFNLDRSKLSVQQDSLNESIRANKAREAETTRSNQAREYLSAKQLFEANRSNLANESIKTQTNLMNFAYHQQQLDLQRHELEERKRSNIVSEQLQIAQIGTNTLTNTLNAYARYQGGKRYVK